MVRSDWTIHTQRLDLHPATEQDVDRLHGLWLDEEVRRYLWDGRAIPRQVAADTIADGIQSFAREGFGIWTAHRIGTPGLIGFAGLKKFGDRNEKVELLYGIAPTHGHRGFATEIARGLIAYGFETLGMSRLYARADIPNDASIRVMQRIGMCFESQTSEGAFGGLYCYAIDRPTFDGST